VLTPVRRGGIDQPAVGIIAYANALADDRVGCVEMDSNFQLRTDGIDGLIAALNRKADSLTGTMAKAL